MQKNQHFLKALNTLVLAGAASLFSVVAANATTYTVTNTNDAGTGSLRQAIINANSNPGTDYIAFNISGTGVKTITLDDRLPLITGPVHIQGYTQPGASQGAIGSRTINIQINGGNTTTNPSGRSVGDGLFRFTSGASGSSISGLSIYNTGSSVETIQLEPGISNVHIWGNYIGLLANGTSPSATKVNKDDGILLANYEASTGSFSNISIGTNGDGTNDANEGNVIANSADPADGGDGIQVGRNGASYTWSGIRISGNYIGLAADGLTAAPNGIASTTAPNGGDGINIRGASNVLVGSDGNGISDDLERNVISGNTGNGIEVNMSATNISIAGNFIGTDKTGTVAIPNATASTSSVPYVGILIVGTNGFNTNIVIGFDDTKHTASVADMVRNIISGNYGMGIQFSENGNGLGNRISGNYIGVDATGNTALGNGQANITHPATVLWTVGVDIYQSNFIIVGTNSNGNNDIYEKNVIAGQIDGRGVSISGSISNANVVAGNYIGVGADGSTAIGNDYSGIVVDQSFNNRIGSDDDGTNDDIEANIIANNGKSTNPSTPSSDGVRIIGSTGFQNRISRNIFYNNKANAIDLANDGVSVNDGTTTSGQPNLLIDYPVFTGYTLSGTTMTVSGYVGACNGSNERTAGTTISGTLTVQIYKEADDGDQNGAISGSGCSRSTAHGEGIQYLGSITVTGGTFTGVSFTLASGVTFSGGDKITGISIDANGNTSEFGVTTLLAITGTVFNDQNGNTRIDGSETGTTAGTNLYVYLVDASGIVVDSAKVNTDGTYSLDALQARTYTIYLSQVLYPIGTNTTTTPINTTPPTGWSTVGENGTNNTGPGDGTPNGALTVVVGTTSVGNQNFAIQKIVLNIKLINFDANKTGTEVLLSWATASEQNNKGFGIERSTEGKIWTNIGFISSLSENGNSNVNFGYYFTDKTPSNGQNYYRLKQVDFDGRYEYSPVRAINFDKEKNINVYPNPARENVIISGLQGREIVRIYDATGRLVQTQEVNSETVNISLTKMSQGIYHISINDAYSKVSTYKLVKE